MREGEIQMAFFKKQGPALRFDPQTQEPAVRKSICTGEMTVGFIEKSTGRFLDLMRVDRAGLEDFCRRTGTEPDQIKTIY